MARLAQSPATERVDLVRGAVQALLAASEIDRAGVWIDEGEIDSHSPRGWPILRGVVSDRNGDDAPSEWARLSLAGLPSLEPLASGRTVQQDLDGTPDQLMLGALLELQRAVWAPVGARGQLRGVVLAGTRRKRGLLPLARVEAVSAELSLAIELEEERRLARQRQADINTESRLLSELTSSGPIDSIFTRLVDACTETAPGGDGLGAVFAILRIRFEFMANAAGADSTDAKAWFEIANISAASFDLNGLTVSRTNGATPVASTVVDTVCIPVGPGAVQVAAEPQVVGHGQAREQAPVLGHEGQPAGADAVQIFDSWASGLPPQRFADWVVRPTRRIVDAVRRAKPGARIIGFPRAATLAGYETYVRQTGVDAVSVDTAAPIAWAVQRLSSRVTLQGNLDPIALIAGGSSNWVVSGTSTSSQHKASRAVPPQSQRRRSST